MTADRFYAALALYHAALIPVTLGLGRRAAGMVRRRRPTQSWPRFVARIGASFAAAAIGLALAVTVIASLPSAPGKPGFLAIRLLAQALFGEGLLLLGWLAFLERRAGYRTRSALLAACAAVLFGTYWRA